MAWQVQELLHPGNRGMGAVTAAHPYGRATAAVATRSLVISGGRTPFLNILTSRDPSTEPSPGI